MLFRCGATGECCAFHGLTGGPLNLVGAGEDQVQKNAPQEYCCQDICGEAGYCLEYEILTGKVGGRRAGRPAVSWWMDILYSKGVGRRPGTISPHDK